MRFSVTLTVVIIAAFAFAACKIQSSITSLSEEQKVLFVQDRDYGLISLDGAVSLPVKKPRSDEGAAAKSFSLSYIAALKTEESAEDNEPYSDKEKRLRKMVDQTYSMSAQQLKVLIQELQAAPDFAKSRLYYQALRTAIQALADTEPQTAMSILSALGHSISDSDTYGCVIRKWALADPLNALMWMRETGRSISECSLAGRHLIFGVSSKEPKLAFQLIEEFGVYSFGDHKQGDGEAETSFDAAAQIVRTARTLEDRTTMLGMLRELSAEKPTDYTRAMVSQATATLAEGLGSYGDEKAIAWLAESNLSKEEGVALYGTLESFKTQGISNDEKLMEWLSDRFDVSR